MFIVQDLSDNFLTYVREHNLNNISLSRICKDVLYIILKKEKEEEDKKCAAYKKPTKTDSESEKSESSVQIETVYQEHHPTRDDDDHPNLTESPTTPRESDQPELDEENHIDAGPREPDVGSDEPVGQPDDFQHIELLDQPQGVCELTDQAKDNEHIEVLDQPPGGAHRQGEVMQGQVCAGKQVEVKLIKMTGSMDHNLPQLGAGQHVQVSDDHSAAHGQNIQVWADQHIQVPIDNLTAPPPVAGQYTQVPTENLTSQLGVGQQVQMTIHHLGAGQHVDGLPNEMQKTPLLAADQQVQITNYHLGTGQHVQVQHGLSMPVVDNTVSTNSHDLSTPTFETTSTDIVFPSSSMSQKNATTEDDKGIYGGHQPSDQLLRQKNATTEDDKGIYRVHKPSDQLLRQQKNATTEDDKGIYRGHQPPDLLLRQLRETTIQMNNKDDPLDLSVVNSQQIRQLVIDLEKQASSDALKETENQALDLSKK